MATAPTLRWRRERLCAFYSDLCIWSGVNRQLTSAVLLLNNPGLRAFLLKWWFLRWLMVGVSRGSEGIGGNLRSSTPRIEREKWSLLRVLTFSFFGPEIGRAHV